MSNQHRRLLSLHRRAGSQLPYEQRLGTAQRHQLGWRDIHQLELRDQLPTGREALREFFGFILAGGVIVVLLTAGCVAVLG